MIKLRISAESILAFKREAEILFNCKSVLDGKHILIEKKLKPQKIIDLCIRSAGIKKAYLDDYCIWERKSREYNNRLPQSKPEFHPTALKPKLARLLINLSNAKSQVVDPFCGTGSIVLESAILKIPAIGIDIDWKSSQKAKKNLRFYSREYKLKEGKDWQILIADATNLSSIFSKKVDAIVTDPPYGRASTLAGKTIKKLYTSFLAEAEKVVKKNHSIIFIRPDFLKINLSNYNVVSEFNWYVHKSLTRIITEIIV